MEKLDSCQNGALNCLQVTACMCIHIQIYGEKNKSIKVETSDPYVEKHLGESALAARPHLLPPSIVSAWKTFQCPQKSESEKV